MADKVDRSECERIWKECSGALNELLNPEVTRKEYAQDFALADDSRAQGQKDERLAKIQALRAHAQQCEECSAKILRKLLEFENR